MALAERESRAYMAELVARAQAEPGEDMLGMLVREHGDDLTTRRADRHRQRCCCSPGTRPPPTCSGWARWPCCATPSSWRWSATTRRRSTPRSRSCCAGSSIVHSGIPRTTTTEVEIGGTPIAAGELVICALPTANRDPALLDRPASALDITRGAPGTSPSATACTTAWARRWPGWRCASPSPRCCGASPDLALAVPYEEIGFRAFHFVYGLHALPVTW